MIYIKRFDRAFLRIPKTGSEALQLFLEQNVVDYSEDVISRPIRLIPSTESTSIKLYKTALNTAEVFPTGHVSAAYTIDKEVCTTQTHFTGVIRDPLERQVSNFIYRLHKKEYVLQGTLANTFKMYITNGILTKEDYKHTMSQVDYFKYEGSLLPNVEFWPYPKFKEKLYQFCESNNVEIKNPLQTINKSPGDKKKLIASLYTPDILEQVMDVYQEDFELYNSLMGTDSVSIQE